MFGCRTAVPEGTDASVVLPCRDMCFDLKSGCAEKVFYDVICDTYKNMSDPAGLKCFYENCECDSQILLPANGKVISKGGHIATNVSEIGCQTF